MKPFICLIISLFMVLMPPESEAQIRKKAKQKAVRYSIHIDDLQVRDPFILADMLYQLFPADFSRLFLLFINFYRSRFYIILNYKYKIIDTLAVFGL